MNTSVGSLPTIIIADSHEDERCLLKSILELKGFSIIEAVDGQQAFDLTLHKRPDLMLIELKLPLVSGFTVIRRMQKLARLRMTPIIAMSVDKPISHQRLALAAGCVAYLNKPIEFDELDLLIGRLLPSALIELPSVLVH